MSEIAPPPPPPPTPPAAPPAPPPTAVVPNPPPALAQLPVGARLEAVIQATLPPPGQAVPATALPLALEVETALGRLLIQTGFPLPATGPIGLQVQSTGAKVQLLITAIHGLAPAQAVRQLGLALPGTPPGQQPGTPPAPGAPGQAASGAQAGTQALGPSSAISLTTGAVVAATVIRPGATPTGPQTGPQTGGSQAPQAGGAQTAPGPGTPGTGAATGGATTPGAVTQGAATGATATGPGGTPAAGGQSTGAPQAGATPAAGGASAATVQAGTQLSLRIAALQPPPQGAGTGGTTALATPPPVGQLAPGGTITGIVTGPVTGAQASGQGAAQVVVNTHAGQLAVSMPTPLPAGSTITFEILSLLPPAGGTTPHAPEPPPQALMLGGWPALEEAVREVQKADPAMAQHLIQAVLPKPGVTLAANMLFFLVALSGGDLRAWIGDGPYRLLQRLNPGLLRRLGDDFGRISRTKEDPGPTSDWRTVPIPLRDDNELQQIRLYMRRAGDDEDEDEGRVATRFVVDLDLSRLGRFQLDGLVYDRDKQMDLIVRTENKLPPPIESGIRDIFQDASEVTGLKGGIAFQAAPANFVEIAAAGPAENPVGLFV